MGQTVGTGAPRPSRDGRRRSPADALMLAPLALVIAVIDLATLVVVIWAMLVPTGVVKMSIGRLTRFAPGAAALANYNREWLHDDLLAGISVAAVAVPIAIAYSQLAGVPPVYGLYASILPLVAYAIFGTSRQLILAPDAATCAIVAAVVTPLAAGDAGRHVSLAATLAIISGVLCIAGGLAGLGFLANFLAMLRRVSHQEFRLALVTLLGVITVGVLPGVVLAIGLAMVHLIARASRPHDGVLGRTEHSGFRDLTRHPEAVAVPGIVIYRFEAALLFFNADYFKFRVRTALAQAERPVRWLVIAAESMPVMDSSGAATLEELCAELAAQGTSLAVAGAHAPVRGMLERSGLVAQIGHERCFATLDGAIAVLADGVARGERVH